MSFQSQIRPSSPEFQKNADFHKKLAKELREKQAEVREGGGNKSRALHQERKKLFVRDRIDHLTDPGTPFLELSSLAANGLYDDQAPSAGIITGVAQVSGRKMMIIANDATVKGGT